MKANSGCFLQAEGEKGNFDLFRSNGIGKRKFVFLGHRPSLFAVSANMPIYAYTVIFSYEILHRNYLLAYEYESHIVPIMMCTSGLQQDAKTIKYSCNYQRSLKGIESWDMKFF